MFHISNLRFNYKQMRDNTSREMQCDPAGWMDRRKWKGMSDWKDSRAEDEEDQAIVGNVL